MREATLALLREFGITKVFGNPGSTELPMFRDFPEDFEYVLGLQESIVLAMADGYAQATRNAALVNLHSAAGTGHALGNLFTAFKNQTPLIVTAGQQARSILPFEPFLHAERASEFPRPYVKFSIEPARAEDVPLAIAQAYHTAMQAPRGPVFVSIPVDDWDMPCSPVRARRVHSATIAPPEIIKNIADRLDAARRPAFVVGAGVALDDAWEETIALAEKTRAAVFVAPMSGRNSFPEDHSLFAGFLPADRAGIVAALDGHDLVLALGAPVWVYHVEGEGPHAPEGTEIIQLGADPEMANRAATGYAVISDLALALGSLARQVKATERPHPKVPARPAELDGSPFTDAYLLQQVAKLRPLGAIIVEEAPSSRGPMHDHLPITDRDGFYTCASGGLGHGLAAAIGVAKGRSHEKVIALIGDGSSMYAIQGLWSAVQQDLPISYIIIKNGKYEALEQFGRHFGLHRTIGTKLPDIDFVGLARAQGMQAEAVSDPAALDDALRRSFAAPHPTLVEVTVK